MAINMRSQVARVVGKILVPLQLIVVVYLSVTMSEWPVRDQQKSNFTGLPIWHNAPCPHPHSVNEKSPSEYVELGSAFITGVASLICIYRGLMAYISRKEFSETVTKLLDLLCCCLPRSRPEEGDSEFTFGTIFLFDTIITTYISATFIALVAGLIFGVGKLWAIFGIFHNVMEVFIVAALCYRKTIKYVAFTCVFTSVYSVVVTGVIGYLHWYRDAMFFKFQGKLFFCYTFKVWSLTSNH